MNITYHAIKRFREQTLTSKPDKNVKGRILDIFNSSTEVRLKPKYRVAALLNHGMVEAKYFKNKEWIMVVVDETIITIHRDDANRWEYFKR